jgi:hypothetical protein
LAGARSSTARRTTGAPARARCARRAGSAPAKHIHVRTAEHVREPRDVGTLAGRVLGRVHLVHEEGVAFGARAFRRAPVVRRDTGRANRGLGGLERTHVDELWVQRERGATTPADLQRVGHLRGQRAADLGVRHVEVAQAQHLVRVRAEVLERLVRVGCSTIVTSASAIDSAVSLWTLKVPAIFS